MNYTEDELVNGAPTLAFADRVMRIAFKETPNPAVACVALVRVICGITLGAHLHAGSIADRRASLLEMVGNLYDQLAKERSSA